ncbi:MAG: CBS domain-containing protein, partial [Methanomicrobiaceae archaeon]|nr:CBS domain-containing protein [Methanomicrobiaceae archaeon]
AVIFGIVGFILFNPILIIIAFFIYIGANQESTMLRYNVLLQDVSVSDVMNSPVVSVPPTIPVGRVLETMYETKHLGLPVVENDTLIGIVALADVQKIPPQDREALIAKDIMTRNPITLPPSAPLMEALRIMSGRNIGRIPVIEDGNLVGIVTRTDIVRVMELREA